MAEVTSQQITDQEVESEIVTLIIPKLLTETDGIQVLTLPQDVGDLSNFKVRVQVAESSEEIVGDVHSEPQPLCIVHEVLDVGGGGIANEAEKDTRVSIAVQANDYEIERRSGRNPARMRVIPAKYRDYKNPENIKEEPESDEDFDPDQELEFKPKRGRDRRPVARTIKKEKKKYARPGRPRKYPKMEPMDLCDTHPPVSGVNQVTSTMATIDSLLSAAATITSGDISSGQGQDSQGQMVIEASASEIPGEKHPEAGEGCDEEQLSISDDKNTSNPDKPFQCKTCGKNFSLRGNLKVHEFIHTGLKPFKCKVESCGKTFRTAEACRRHEMTHLGIKLFECEICKGKFSTNQARTEHMSRHLDARPHSCHICKKTFRQVSCLHRHLKVHSDEKPFQCEICNKCFSMSGYLKSHRKSHTGERPFQCKQCDKSFAHQSDLNRHKVIHTGKKPYSCELCSARFNDPSSKRRHMRDHSENKPYSCQMCSESFRRAGQLKVHLKQHMGLLSYDNVTKYVTQKSSDGSCLGYLLRDDGKIEPVSLDQGEKVMTTEGEKAPEGQLEHVQSQLQEVLMQLRQRNAMPSESGDVNVQVVTLGPDGQVEKRMNRIISQTLSSIEQSEESQTIAEVQEQELAVQIALDEIAVIQDGEIHDMTTNAVNDVQNVGLNVITTGVNDAGPLSPSVLSTAQIMQDIRNTPVHHEPTNYSPVGIVQNQVSTSEADVAQTFTSVPSSSHDAISSIVFSIPEVARGHEVTVRSNSGEDRVIHYEVVEEIPADAEQIMEFQLTDEGTFHVAQDATQSQAMVQVGNSAQPENFVQPENPTEPKDVAPPQNSILDNSSVQTQNYVQGTNTDLTPIQNPEENQTSLQSQIPVHDQNLVQNHVSAQDENFMRNQSSGEDQNLVHQPNSVPEQTPGPSQNSAPVSGMDYVDNPDFSSQEYYNWLSSFVELCKVVPMPLDIDLFQKVSQVHKTLSDVLANPSGVLSIKDNFQSLMTMSRDLSSIVTEHLTFILKQLEDGSLS